MKIIYNIKLILLILLSGSCSSCNGTNGDPINEGDHPEVPAGDVTIFVTTSNRSQDFRKQTANFSEKSNMSPTTIKLEPSTRFQTMDGFGAAITGSTAYNLMQMTKENRTKFLKETFSPTEGMGLSYVRISIGCSDFSLSEYTLCDTLGIENFALHTGRNNLCDSHTEGDPDHQP